MSPVDRLLHSGLLYDLVQYAVGADLIHRKLTSAMAALGNGVVVDVGAGTGLYMSCLPAGADYVWYDRDVDKLRRFRHRHHAARAVLGDATMMAFADKSVDWTLCVNVTHHLSEIEFDALLREICRVTRRSAFIHDPLDVDRWMSRTLWRIDRGSHPRTRTALLAALGRHVHVRQVAEFGRFHRYLLAVGDPR